MSARLARTALSAAARRAPATAATARLAPRRAMSAAAHGPAKSSDTPWIVGATLVFLPAFLYLVSPSARKAEHHVHDDKHDYPGLKSKKAAPLAEPETDAPAATLMADDEGTVADVGASIAVAEGSNAPKAAQTPEEQSANLAAAEAAPVDVEAPAAEQKEESSVEESAEKSEPSAEDSKSEDSA